MEEDIELKSVNDEKEEDLLWEEFKKTKSSKLRDKFSVWQFTIIFFN